MVVFIGLSVFGGVMDTITKLQQARAAQEAAKGMPRKIRLAIVGAVALVLLCGFVLGAVLALIFR